MEQRFGKINLVVGNTGQRGELVAREDSLEFLSKKGTLPMPKVRGLSYSGGKLTVEYGEGPAIQTVQFVDLSQGGFKSRSATQQLEAKLRGALTLAPVTAEDQANLQQARMVRSQQAGKRGRTRMAIGGVLAVIGAVVTIATYSAASSSSSGGTYLVAWGPMVFGVILFIQGLVESRSAQREQEKR